MSRMEKNKKLHERLEKESSQAAKESIFARREAKRRNQRIRPSDSTSSADEPVRDILSQNIEHPRASDPRAAQSSRKQSQVGIKKSEGRKSAIPPLSAQRPAMHQGQEQSKQKPQKLKKSKQPKQKKKRKHPVLRIVVRVLLVLFAYSLIAFLVGQQVARSDAAFATTDEETFNGTAAANGARNILLIGSDSREGEAGRADTIMVLQLDGPSKQPKLLSFMRDTLVTIPGYGENKINAAYAFGGADLVRQTLAENFGLETNYYAKVDFRSFEKVIDTLFPSGVAINAEKDMSKNLEVAIKQGQQQMNGLELLQYARFRMDEEGDFGRVRRQQQVMDAIFSEMKNPLAILKLPYAAGKVLGYASTNLPMSFLLKNTFSIARGAGGVDSLTVPVADSWQYGSSASAGSVLVVNLETNQQAIRNFLNE
ncbi:MULTISPECIES: LCP family protein [Enterococcus]|uniref:LCP family protein n=1 Tax=Enterococcus TaxID=1350 RepID=UPI00054D138F|nr:MULTISPECIES: LCP family protein [Enterococcus]MBE9898737.1 LCP family protein [Enterococcus casseliflavus]MBE9902023.1 LCP family protein [Enterococcus casseliflavus]MBE9922430.1 LCP family protein [Enterococcus casseliflavus]MDO0894549.1 LCP family protein [Enterococcus sp. B1E4]MDO0907503.1 LCP family protein [Enterococcus sp. B2E4]